MMGHEGPDLRQVNPLMHAERLGREIARQRRQTGWAEVGAVIDDIIGLIAHCAAMALMTGLGSAGLGFLPLLFAVCRGRLGGGARGLLGPLQTQHQLDQLVLAQTLKFAAPHPALESAKTPSLKGWVILPWVSLVARELGV